MSSLCEECVSLVNIHKLSIKEKKESLHLRKANLNLIRKDDVESFKDYGYGEDLKTFFEYFLECVKSKTISKVFPHYFSSKFRNQNKEIKLKLIKNILKIIKK